MSHPRYYYIFCNLLNPLTLHNLRFTKGFASAGAGSWAISKMQEGDTFWQSYEDGTANYLPFQPSERTPKQAKAISPFQINVTAEYRVEHDAELYRHANKPLFPSRFSAIYAFGDWESCQAVADKYGWDLQSVRVFKLEPAPFNRVCKVNMEVVSLARDAYRTASFSAEEINKIWHHYWNGGGDMQLEYMKGNTRNTVSTGVIWEYLIEGRVNKVDADPETFKPQKPEK